MFASLFEGLFGLVGGLVGDLVRGLVGRLAGEAGTGSVEPNTHTQAYPIPHKHSNHFNNYLYIEFYGTLSLKDDQCVARNSMLSYHAQEHDSFHSSFFFFVAL